MAASFVASFVIFLIIGLYTLIFREGLEFIEDGWVRFFIILTMLSNACYYYYFAAYTELDTVVRDALRNSPRREWLIRVLNHAFVLSLWFWLEGGWIYFGAALFILYVTYIWWDYITWTSFPNHLLFWLDVAGFVVTILFFWLTYLIGAAPDPSISGRYQFFLGLLTTAYLVIIAVGFLYTPFKLFSKQYWTRPGLH